MRSGFLLEFVILALGGLLAVFVAQVRHRPISTRAAILSVLFGIGVFVLSSFLWAVTGRDLGEHATCVVLPNSSTCKAAPPVSTSRAAPATQVEPAQAAPLPGDILPQLNSDEAAEAETNAADLANLNSTDPSSPASLPSPSPPVPSSGPTPVPGVPAEPVRPRVTRPLAQSRSRAGIVVVLEGLADTQYRYVASFRFLNSNPDDVRIGVMSGGAFEGQAFLTDASGGSCQMAANGEGWGSMRTVYSLNAPLGTDYALAPSGGQIRHTIFFNKGRCDNRNIDKAGAMLDATFVVSSARGQFEVPVSFSNLPISMP